MSRVVRAWFDDARFGPLVKAASQITFDFAPVETLNKCFTSNLARANPALHFERDIPKRQRTRAHQRYDAKVATEFSIPTREENLHDFFNALVFATFPRAKLALHQRQNRAAKTQRLPSGKLKNRTPEQDALTAFDEGGTIVIADEPTTPRRVLRADESRAHFLIFGHALYESIACGKAHFRSPTITLVMPNDSLDNERLHDVDEALCHALTHSELFTSPKKLQSLAVDSMRAA